MQARDSFWGARPARRLLLAAALVAGGAGPLAADAAAPTVPKVVPVAPLPGPTSPVPTPRRPTARLRALRADRDLTYQEEAAEPESTGLLARLVRWLLRLLSGGQRTTGGRIAWNTLFYGLAIGILVFAVLKFLQIDVTQMFGRSGKKGGLGYEVGEEDIHALDFTEAIAQAEAGGNLRLAVRLGYLRLLKQLTDQALIDWQPDKTNQAYLRELAAARPDLRPAFAELTRQFEYVWYGEWPLPPASYPALRDGQQQLGRALGRPALASGS